MTYKFLGTILAQIQDVAVLEYIFLIHTGDHHVSFNNWCHTSGSFIFSPNEASACGTVPAPGEYLHGAGQQPSAAQLYATFAVFYRPNQLPSAVTGGDGLARPTSTS